MKRILYKSSIILPLAMAYFSIIDPFRLCIPEIGLYMGTWSSLMLIVTVTVVWLCCSPFRRGVCNGTITELIFNIIPVEFVMMLVFMQKHFVITLLIGLIMIGGEIALFIALKKDERKQEFSERLHRKYRLAFRRYSVFGIAALCAVPSLIATFVDGVGSSTYSTTEELYDQMFSETETSEADKSADPYEGKTELWSYLKEENWSQLSIQEKMTVTQELVDFESEVLGITSVPVAAELIGAFTLGSYDDETKQMRINTEHLANLSSQEIIGTICHEVHHSYVDYLVTTLDWDNPAMNCAYFAELRELKDSLENYKSSQTYGYEAYESQPLEVAAREYSEQETAKIMTYIEACGEGE